MKCVMAAIFDLVSQNVTVTILGPHVRWLAETRSIGPEPMNI